MIGSVEEAVEAEYKHRTGHKTRGWRTVGSGVSRTAYLSPSGVVYKVGDGDANYSEYLAFQKYSKWKRFATKGVFFPEASLYDIGGEIITGVEYIKKTSSTWCNRMHWDKDWGCSCKPLTRANRMCYADLNSWLEYRGLMDMHEGNVFNMNDKIYVIDLGFN